jgi:hypothetical protein
MTLDRFLHEREQLVRFDGVKLDGDFAEVLRSRARGLKPRRAYEALVAVCTLMMRLGLAGLSRMLRPCWRVIALTVIVTYLSITAQAAHATLTLACQGITTDASAEECRAISLGLGFATPRGT